VNKGLCKMALVRFFPNADMGVLWVDFAVIAEELDCWMGGC
jgi:hypothetical protein